MLGGAIGNLTVAYFAAGTPLVVQGHVITTTAEHPFYVAGEERFVPAGELTLEDQLVDSQGRPIAIDAIRVTDRLITVYNLRVADFHTYFVGGKLWQFDAWVHNASDIYDPSGIAPNGTVGTTFGEARPRGLAYSPLREGEIDQYRYFSKRPGDGLEGHEVWQSANTGAYGIGGRTGAIGGRNPSIAIATQNHRQIVNKLQSEMIPDAASTSALDNIKANMCVLREAQRRGVGITDRQINDAGRKAVRFYMRLLKEGAIRE